MEKKNLKDLKMSTYMENKDFYKNYIEIFLNQNSKLNLISKNDEKFLWEKHICDSLAIESFFKEIPLEGKKLLDIGTGGGFPAIPIALTYPQIEVFALDSIRKKINAIENIKQQLRIKNLHPICDRAEKIKDKFDLITSRAVAPLKVISVYALPLLKNNGYFIAYKSRRTNDEMEDAKNILKKYQAKIINIIEYKLPLTEDYTRNLIVIQKK